MMLQLPFPIEGPTTLLIVPRKHQEHVERLIELSQPRQHAWESQHDVAATYMKVEVPFERVQVLGVLHRIAHELWKPGPRHCGVAA